VYRQALEASAACPCSDAAGLLAVKAFKRLKGRLALAAQEDSRQALALLCVCKSCYVLTVMDDVGWASRAADLVVLGGCSNGAPQASGLGV